MNAQLFASERVNVIEIVFGPVAWHSGSFSPGLKFLYK